MEVLQTSALPLGYGAGRDVGWASMKARLHGGAVTAWQPPSQPGAKVGAGNGIRTRDFDLGKVALYH
jgi:hypothetical protein